MIMQRVNCDLTPTKVETRKVRVAICGEASSGKSSVLNALLRERVVEDNLGRTTRPTVFAGYRPAPGIARIDPAGREIGTGEEVQDVCELHLWSAQSHLQGFEFVEIPLTSPDELTEAQIALVASCDVMIWVTIASQAWRLTEKTMIELLGDARPDPCILAVSRADKLRCDDDRNRLRKRVERESASWFDRCVFIGASRALLAEAGESEECWEKTGGVALLEALRDLTGIEDPDARKAQAPNWEAPSAEVVPFPEAERITRGRPVAIAQPTPQPAAKPVPRPMPTRAPTPVPERAPNPVPRPEPDPIRVAAETISVPAEGLAPVAQAPLCSDMARDAYALDLPFEGVLAAGQVQPGQEAVDPLHGTRDRIEQTARAAQRLVETLGASYAENFDETLASVTISTRSGRILVERLPEDGLVFSLCDAQKINAGAALRMLSQIARAQV